MIEIIGGSGFVGTTVVEEIKDINAPSHAELDITNLDSVKRYLKSSKAEVVVNFAAFTNVKAANINSELANQLNIDGPKNLAIVCKATNKFLIHFSTDGVYPLPDEYKGPHSETENPIDDPELVSAYGLTKLRGETKILESGARAAIVRIAYPFGNAQFPDKDYVIKLIKTIKLGYGLFTDQYLSATHIQSLVPVIETLTERQLPGIFHWVCRDLFTPFEMASYVNEKLRLNLEIKKGSLVELIATKGKQPYAKYGGLSTEITEEKLGLTPPTWKAAIVEFLSKARVNPNIPDVQKY